MFVDLPAPPLRSYASTQSAPDDFDDFWQGSLDAARPFPVLRSAEWCDAGPSTVYGAYNAYAGPKRIHEWTYNGHEGGGVDDDVLALNALRDALGGDR